MPVTSPGLKTQIAAEQTLIAGLTQQKPSKNDNAADQLEVAKAQLDLDQDELADAQQNLANQGGDRHALLEQEMQAHEAALKEPAQFPKTETEEQPTPHSMNRSGSGWAWATAWIGPAPPSKQASAKTAALEKQTRRLRKAHEKASANRTPTIPSPNCTSSPISVKP